MTFVSVSPNVIGSKMRDVSSGVILSPTFLRGIEDNMIFPSLAQPKFYVCFHGETQFM